MLRAYGPGCDGTILDAKHGRIPESAVWVDLEEPTRDEEELVERTLGFGVPTREEMVEIEPSSRLYERDGVLFLTMSVLCGVEDGAPGSEPISFVLSDRALVTVRYVTPKPIRAFMAEVRHVPSLAISPAGVMIGMLEAVVDRLADELEALGAEIQRVSDHIFIRNPDSRRIPADRLTALLTRIGRTQSLLARVRETTVSSGRLVAFFSGSSRYVAQRDGHSGHLEALTADINSLVEHSSFLGNNLAFLLDASLGLISIEQNAAMKLFSWAALVFLPPTLVAGIYGMNFEHMPELAWLYGYPMALTLIFASAVLPVLYLKMRRWI